MALARQIFREDDVPGTDALDSSVPDLDFCLPRERNRVLPSWGAVPVQDIAERRHSK